MGENIVLQVFPWVEFSCSNIISEMSLWRLLYTRFHFTYHFWLNLRNLKTTEEKKKKKKTGKKF